jgi:hypothetical protein
MARNASMPGMAAVVQMQDTHAVSRFDVIPEKSNFTEKADDKTNANTA